MQRQCTGTRARAAGAARAMRACLRTSTVMYWICESSSKSSPSDTSSLSPSSPSTEELSSPASALSPLFARFSRWRASSFSSEALGLGAASCFSCLTMAYAGHMKKACAVFVV